MLRSLNGYIKESILDTTDTGFDAVLAILAGKGSISADDLKIIPDLKTRKELVLPEGITSITRGGVCSDVADLCPALERIVFPSTLREIDSETFAYMRNLEEVVFDPRCEGVVLFNTAFGSCSKLRSVNIPKAAKLGSEVFVNCYSLTDLSFDEYVYLQGSGIFHDCRSLEKVDMSRVIIDKSILPSRTFCACGRLREVLLHRSVSTIGERAFEGCKGLTSIKAPGVDTIHVRAFARCESLVNLGVGDTIAIGSDMHPQIYRGSTFEGCTKLKTIDSTITDTIHNSEFKDCSNLTELTLGGYLLFRYNENPFEGCTNLKVLNLVNPRNPKSGRADNIELVLSKALPSTTKIVLKK